MNEREDILSQLVEIKLKSPEDFLRVRETLTRIGLTSKGKNVLTQTCHILHKKGRYYCVHFLELYALDGKKVDIEAEDILRRNRIACLLEDWGMVEVVDKKIKDEMIAINRIKILNHNEKEDWELRSLYSVGKKF